MQLKSIKLAGFKSFVDPTIITMQGAMNAIVGPNGCGKSNIVDAIRWVIGETSAKQLRGQSMSDVIFNGTSSRKPVGQATVELIFDNSDGRLAGEYAAYSEISIRRQVERDSISTYFINGVPSRRRDVLDVFLGTGLGSRSYSIIEQGMISRLIEAKPEELRAHLEEVAGISRYKERRRETENRIRRTRENLDRLNDIHEEVVKQLRHLKRQVNAAERYKQYKQEQRLLSAQLKALQWGGYQSQMQQYLDQIEQQQLSCDEVTTAQRSVEVDMEQFRQQQVTASDDRNDIQKRFYTLGAEVARLEQQIHHYEQQSSEWQKELLVADASWEELNLTIVKQQQMVKELTDELTELTPLIDGFDVTHNEAQQALTVAEEEYADWQSQWEQGQQAWSDTTRKTELSRNNINHFERELQSLQKQEERLSDEQQALTLKSSGGELEALTQHNDELQKDMQQLQQSMDSTAEAMTIKRDTQAHLTEAVEEQRYELQQMQARHTSLDALQQSALGGDDSHTSDWLEKHGLQDTLKLGQQLQVAAGWEATVEMVLGHYFEALCVEDLSCLLQHASDLNQGHLVLLDNKHNEISGGSAHPTLISKIQCDWPLQQWLGGIYIASSLQQAHAMCDRLQPHESVVTQDGLWLGPNWMKVAKVSQDDDSVLLRQREIETLQENIASFKDDLADIEGEWRNAKEQLLVLEAQRESEHNQFKTLTATITTVQSELSAKQTQQQALEQQQKRIVAALEECLKRQEELQQSIQQHHVELSQLSSLSDEEAEQKQLLLAMREQVNTALQQARNTAQEHRQRYDQAKAKVATHHHRLDLLRETIDREQRQITQVDEKRGVLQQQLSQTDSPIKQLQCDLQGQLELRVEVEKKLHIAEDHLQGIITRIRELEQVRMNKDKLYKQLQTTLQQHQMERQALTVRQTTIAEQLAEQELDPQQLLQEMPESVDCDEWEQQLETVTKRIERLGPINLAAIGEHKTLSQRQEYLDQQHTDLTEALALLEGAIAKIDKSTRAMFRDTFQAVNQSFSALFPTIFGGGKASLELTEADYLTTGVQVMAQPPGKRNTTIHMLSGGEKALTAIALVFAMFKLNPAPFCILDEVDAPLDDVNVGRYCNLLKAMENNTQFLVISHNKVTISMADHMLGVTMQEAGVSRLVSVDMNVALEMAEA